MNLLNFVAETSWGTFQSCMYNVLNKQDILILAHMRQQPPLGVQPYGALLYGGRQQVRDCGAFCVLGDELLLRVLGCLRPSSLGPLAVTCKALYCYTNHEELWRTLVLSEYKGSFTFKGTWKATYVAEKYSAEAHAPRLAVEGVYSDLLYQSFLCATTPILGDWLSVSNVDRRADLSLDDFRLEYENPNQPVIITDVVTGWPAFRSWNRERLREAFGKGIVTVGDYSMKFDDFLIYADLSSDDMPLYLFDKTFAKTAPSLVVEYQVPEYFAEDLFGLLGEERRPDYRWLIMGPARSGSSFHKDPNCTSAWNAVVSGAKKWILYPPNTTPPGGILGVLRNLPVEAMGTIPVGIEFLLKSHHAISTASTMQSVFASEDGANVAAPVSIIEWFLNFYSEACEGRERPRECIVRAGELLFVPRGWWHMALNLEESIAVTQNYVGSANLAHVLDFLSSKSPDLISGCDFEERATLHSRFTAALAKARPQILEAAQRQLTGRSGAKRKAEGLPTLFFNDDGKKSERNFRFGFAA